MPKFAPVAPIQVLEGLYAAGPQVFGNYHLLLAHHTVEHEGRFKDLFKRMSDDGHHVTVIMDNSIVELGSAVDNEMIAEAVNIIKEGDHTVYPVLPDVMGDGLSTRREVDKAYPIWEHEMPGDGFVAVCQGVDFQDYEESLEMFGDKKRFPSIAMLSIPRVLTKNIGSRVKPALKMRDYIGSHKIHFLGFSDDISDDLDSVAIIPEAAIDSAVPLRVRECFGEFTDAGKRPADWFETAQVDKRMIDNLQTARFLFGDR